MTAAWTVLDALDAVRVGAVGRTRVIESATAASARMHGALAAVGGTVAAPGVADVCADPLVFAVASGLPRPEGYQRSIDGGSSWRDVAPMGRGPLYAVSRIADMAQRTAGDGRQLLRVVYETQFTDADGVLVGVAEGVSLHIGVAS